MKKVVAAFLMLGLGGCAHCVAPVDPVVEVIQISEQQAEVFGPLAALAGTRWYAQPAEASTETTGDLQYWYWEFGGSVLAQRHALEDGSYGGVTYIYPNSKTGELDFVYVTSAGFHTSGTFTVNADGSWTALEDVAGHDTITQVRSIGRIDPEGRVETRSEYLDSGQWVPGHAFIGKPTDRPVPVVKSGDDG